MCPSSSAAICITVKNEEKKMNKTEIADKNLDQITGGRSLTPDNPAGISEVDLSELIKIKKLKIPLECRTPHR